MAKKKYKLLLLTLLLITITSESCFSYQEVKITPTAKISTSNTNLQEGDYTNFVIEEDVFIKNKLILKKGTPVQGLITSIEQNGFAGQDAKITIEQFDVIDNSDRKIRLIGSVYKKGDSHEGFLEFIPIEWVRGGEVQIKPQKDYFKLFIKD